MTNQLLKNFPTLTKNRERKLKDQRSNNLDVASRLSKLGADK